MTGEILLKLGDKPGNRENFADRNGVDPDGGLGRGAFQMVRDSTEAFAEALTILAVPGHLQEPEGKAHEQSDGQKCAVNQVHEGRAIVEQSEQDWLFQAPVPSIVIPLPLALEPMWGRINAVTAWER